MLCLHQNSLADYINVFSVNTFMEKTHSKEDVTLLNLLRCEPPNLAFDFFGYGGLTRSVFRYLQEIPDLEKIISNKAGEIIAIPCSSCENAKEHNLMYDNHEGVLSVMANTVNQFSGKSDAKFFATVQIKGSDQKDYTVNFLAIEVYREKGNAHPIWELGFYITPCSSKDVIYGEESIIEVPNSESRSGLYRMLTNFIKSAKKINFDSSLIGINRENKDIRYLNSLVENETTKVIDHSEFNDNRSKWFRYLLGTMDIQKKLKFEDRLGYEKGFRKYRVVLTSSHLDHRDVQGGYSIKTLASTEGDIPNPNWRVKYEGPYYHEEALKRFLEIGNTLLNLMYINAEKSFRQFDIALDPTHIDFTFATIVRDKDNLPVTITSWETPYGKVNNLLPNGKIHHYLQLWGNSKVPLVLDEGANFDDNVHPKKFMARLIEIMPQINYQDGSGFVEQALNYGVPLIR